MHREKSSSCSRDEPPSAPIKQGSIMNRAASILCLSLVCCSTHQDAATIEKPWMPHVDGIFTKGEFIDLNNDETDRLCIRYGPISDSGVELERIAHGVVVWRSHVKPLGVEHSKYRHEVYVRVEDGKIQVHSRGAQEIYEIHDLKTGAFISRVVSDKR